MKMKIYNFVSIIIVILFNLYIQYQEIVEAINEGMSINLIFNIWCRTYLIIFFPFMIILIAFFIAKYGINIKHKILQIINYSSLLTIFFISTFIVALRNNYMFYLYALILGIIFVVGIILKYIEKRKHILR